MQNKKAKIPVIIVLAILVLILLATIVINFVSLKAISPIEEFSWLELSQAGSQSRIEINIDDENYNDAKNAMNASKFSIMQGLLEGKPTKGFHFLRDDDKEKIKAKKQDIDSVAAVGEEILVVAKFDNVDTLKIEKDTIKYDTIKFVVGNTGSQVVSIKMYAYVALDFISDVPTDPDTNGDGVVDDNDDVDATNENRYINPFYINVVSREMYNTFSDIIDASK